MYATNNSGKAALVLAAAAFVISVANVGGPAIAGALAGDSDTVDGFHAVKSSTSAKQRKGKLVATSPKNGRLPNNIIKKAPDAAKLAGKPLNFFLSTGAAAAIYETAAHATATYETKALADATYQTKVAAAAAGNETVVVTLFTPPIPTDSFTTLTKSFATAKAGRLQVSVPVHLRVACPSTTEAIAWLTLDGAVIQSSAQPFPANTAQMANLDLTGVTAAPVSAGAHELKILGACRLGTLGFNEWITTSHAFVTVFGSGHRVTP